MEQQKIKNEQITEQMKQLIESQSLGHCEKLHLLRLYMCRLESIEKETDDYRYLEYVARARDSFYERKDMDNVLRRLDDVITYMPPYYLKGRVAMEGLLDDFIRDYDIIFAGEYFV